MIRSALLVTLGVAITAFMSFWAVVFSIFPNAHNKVHKIANLWGKILLLICNTKVEVIGKENLQPGKPHVFMANHQSDFDILIALALYPRPIPVACQKRVIQYTYLRRGNEKRRIY